MHTYGVISVFGELLSLANDLGRDGHEQQFGASFVIGEACQPLHQRILGVYNVPATYMHYFT